GTDDFLARAVAAALGADLVLDVAAGGAELGEALDGAGNIEGGRPEAGVDVDDQRHITDVGDAAHVDQHVVQGVDAQVGQAQRAGSHTAPGKIDGPVTGTLGQQGVVGVDGADDLQGLLFLECLAKTGAGRLKVLSHGSSLLKRIVGGR